MNRKPTLYDVATAAGVSHMTVSRVFSGKAPIADGTRKRVLEVAKKLGFVPSRRAQAFASGKAQTVGLVYGQAAPFIDSVYGQLIHGLAACLGERHYDLLMIPALGDAADWGRKLNDERVDGCFVMDPAPDGIGHIATDSGLPMVFLNMKTDVPVVHVNPDDVAGGRIATEHLLELGHRRIVYAWVGNTSHHSITDREKGCRIAMQQAGLTSYFSAVRVDRLQPIAAKTEAPDATAFVFHKDTLAAEFIRQATALGTSIPKDLSVVGFNNDRLGMYTSPQLTTVALPLKPMVERAIEELFAQLETERGRSLNDPQFISPRPGLLIRESTSPIGF